MKKKSLKTEGLFSLVDKFMSSFFDALKKGAEDQVIQQARKAKLPPEAIAHMEKMKKQREQFRNTMINAVGRR